MSRKKERRRTDVDARIATAAAAQETLFLPCARGRVHRKGKAAAPYEFGIKASASIVTTNVSIRARPRTGAHRFHP